MIPRVTQILADLGLSPNYAKLLPPEKLERLRQRGTALHATFEWLEAGTLDEATVHEELRPGLEAYRAWRRDVGHVVWASELALTHPEWGYCGHPDRVGLVNGEPAVIDWKYSESADVKSARLQLAGYRKLVNEASIDADTGMARWHNLVHECYVVELSPTKATYRMHRVTDAAAEQVFLAAVIVWKELHKKEIGDAGADAGVARHGGSRGADHDPRVAAGTD